MTRITPVLTALVAAAVIAGGCGFEHARTPLVPTSTDGAGNNTPNPVLTPSLIGLWSSNGAAALPSTDSCGNFQYQITNQTGNSITGTFSGLCGQDIAITGQASGQLNGASVPLTVTGSATLPNTPTPCAFTLSGTGTVEDNGNTLRIPFNGTTCFGPVSGVEVLRRPQAQAQQPISAPSLVSPSANAHLDTTQPRLTVTNAPRAGAVGPVVDYQFEVANDEAFASPFGSWNVPEQANETSLVLPQALAYSQVYYWRVRATDGTPGAWSITRAFQAPNPPAAPAPPSTPAGNGQDAIDLRQAVITGASPRDVAFWPVTTRLNVLDFRTNGVYVEFSKKQGAGRWPDVVPPGWDGALQYTLWMVVKINGQWYTSGGVEYWYGLDRQGGPPADFARNWYYSPAVWGPLASHQPSVGEQVGFFVTAGDSRAKDVRSVTERSNVVIVPFPSNAGARYQF